MSLTNNLLYLFLLYAVLDKDNKLSLNIAIIVALAIMAFGLCCNPKIVCCNTQNCSSGTSSISNAFFTANGL
ncbi:MAG: hypothetical protein PHX51_03590 [Clostridia bacterium]|nr:hypothetical protein [Clostridia bacterium]